MRFLFTLLLVLLALCFTNSRPFQKEELESGINDLESEDDIEIAADAINDEKSNNFLKEEAANQEDSSGQSQGIFFENSYQESNAGDDSSLDADENLISDYKAFDKSDSNPEKYSEAALNYNEKTQLSSDHQQSNRYTENNDLNHQLEPVEHIINRNVKIYNGDHMRNPQNKRTIHALADEGIKNSQMNKYNNKHIGNNNEFEQSHIFKHYKSDKTRVDPDMSNRDRRNVQEKERASKELSSKNNEYLVKSDTANEELAIKNHIKKLSDTELEELLNSLSEEKRALLRKNINDDNLNNAVREDINKREITKKSGAVEENNLVEGVQSDVNKIQNSLSAHLNTESSELHNSDTTTVISKQTENSEKVDESTTKSPETSSDSENKSDLTNHSDEINQVTLDNNLESDASNVEITNKANVVNTIETDAKGEAKRETNLNNIEDIDMSLDDLKLSENDYYNNKNEQDISLNEEYNICPQYENIAQISEDEIQARNEKREVTEKDNDIFDSIKALEESFPNAKNVGVTSSNSRPLIRVKRTDFSKHNKTKRLAEILPETKVGYYPHRTENLDEDYEEGREFNNGIFYDRTSNLKCKNKRNSIPLKNNIKSEQGKVINKNLSHNLNTISINETNENEKMGLGADNDSVLSGVEGVDENLMFNSKLYDRLGSDININNNLFK